MNGNTTVRERIERDEQFFDSAVVQHGYAPFLRDYDVVIEVPAARPDGTGSYIQARYRYRFTHCVEVESQTTVSPTTWQLSWADYFTDREAWTQAGEPDGYLWAVGWAEAYPGLKYVDDSDRASDWSQRLGHQMHEASIQTNAWNIRVVFHDLVIDKLPAGSPDDPEGELSPL